MEEKAALRPVLIFIIFLVVCLLAPLCYSQNFASPVIDGQRILEKASLEERDGTVILHLAGTPYEMGFQHGSLLKENIRAIFSAHVLDYLNSEAKKRSWRSFPHISLIQHFRSKAKWLESDIPEDYRQELKGLADGSGLNYEDILLMHTFLDTSALSKLNLEPKFRDWLKRSKTVIFYKPETGNSFVIVGFPGLIGGLMGLNVKGVGLNEINCEKTESSARGIPLLFLTRQVLQYSDSVYDAIRVISASARTTKGSIAISDIRTKRGCAIEFSPDRYDVTFDNPAVDDCLGQFLKLKEELKVAISEEVPVDPFEFYSYKKAPFDCELKSVRKAREYEHYTAEYPSIVETDYPEDKVSLDFYEPKGCDTYPAVIFLSHMAGGVSQIEGEFCRDLAANGIAVLLLQTAYQKSHKQSRGWLMEESERPVTKEMIQLLRQLVIETRRGIDWLESLPKVQKDKIGLMGISLGGIVVPVVAATDERVASMAIILGGGGLGEIIWNSTTTKVYKKRFAAENINSALELERKMWMLDPLTFAFKAKGKPTIMINAHFDTGVPRTNTLKLWRALERPKLIWLPTGHYTSLFVIGYAKIKIFQHFYGEFIDKDKAKWIKLDYFPGSPLSKFRFRAPSLMGHNLKFDVSANFTSDAKYLKLGVIVDELFEKSYFGGTHLFGRTEEDDRYQLDGWGGTVLFGKRLSENTHGYLKYSYETIDVHDVAQSAPTEFHMHSGRRGVSTLSLNWERNTLDDPLYPIDGSYRGVSLGVASKILGGDFDFIRATGEARWYISTPFPKITLVVRGLGGWVGEFGETKNVPFFERFYVGGSDTVRGYKWRSIGPGDAAKLPLWGNIMIVGNAEVRFPIFKGLNGAIFFDTGSSWDRLSDIGLPNDLKNSVGGGVRYRTNWTVLRVDYGYPLNRGPKDRAGRFNFALGVPF